MGGKRGGSGKLAWWQHYEYGSFTIPSNDHRRHVRIEPKIDSSTLSTNVASFFNKHFSPSRTVVDPQKTPAPRPAHQP